MTVEHKAVDDCIARVMQMSDDDFCNIAVADKQCLRKTLMEIVHLRESLRDLREAISPGRIGKPEYYIGVAKRMREKEVRLRLMNEVRLCSRKRGHDGPCNGMPRNTCPKGPQT